MIVERAHMEAYIKLLHLTKLIGEYFGTEDLSQLLYALIRMEKPETIVELGTGLGTSALWMALAAEVNGRGHVVTVDDFDILTKTATVLPTLSAAAEYSGLGTFHLETPEAYFQEVPAALGVGDRLTVVRRRIDLEQDDHFEDYPFSNLPVDLLFSDFQHGPEDIVRLLHHFLPRMDRQASLFIDSVPSAVASYLTVNEAVSILNSGRVPAAIGVGWSDEARWEVTRRRYTVVHLREEKERTQSGTTWVRIEPLDVYPVPASRA